MAEDEMKTFDEFWPFYVREHSRAGTRALHAAGTVASAALLLALAATGRWRWLPVALVALSAEAAGFFDARRIALADAVRLRDMELAKQLSLSVIWALYGAGLLLVGRVRRVRLLRLMALALLSLTTLKVFFWDLSSLDRVYRIISFVVLGAILLAVSYLYQKSQQRASEEEEQAPPAADTTEAAG